MSMFRFISFLAGTIIVLAGSGQQASDKSNDGRLTEFVNPFIGTGYHGHTFPGAAYLHL